MSRTANRKVHIKKPTAVIVKGNAEHLAVSSVNKKTISDFHGKLKKILQSEGYKVSFDPGLPHTSPRKADVWVGHSRGADRLRFAPKGTLGVPVGSSRPNAINHPADQKWMDDYEKNVLKGRGFKAVPVKERPPVPKEHLMVTRKMEKELRSRVRAHMRNVGGKQIQVKAHERKSGGHVEQRARERSTVTQAEISKLRKSLKGRKLRKGETYHHTWPGRGHGIIGDVGKKKTKHVLKTIYKSSDRPPGRRLTKTAVVSKEEIHRLADKKGIPWDADPKFKRWSKKLTGKSCLDTMSPKQLTKIKRSLKARGMKKEALAGFRG